MITPYITAGAPKPLLCSQCAVYIIYTSYVCMNTQCWLWCLNLALIHFDDMLFSICKQLAECFLSIKYSAVPYLCFGAVCFKNKNYMFSPLPLVLYIHIVLV